MLNFMTNPNMNSILLSEVVRIKLNEVLNQALLKDKIEEIGIHSRARPTILLYLFIFIYGRLLALKIKRLTTILIGLAQAFDLILPTEP